MIFHRIHVRDAIADHQFELGMAIPHRATDFRQILFAGLDYHAVDFNHLNDFHRRMSHHFAHRATIAAADHQHLLGRRVRKQRYMGNHFMIDKFIKNRSLKHIIEHQHPAKLK